MGLVLLVRHGQASFGADDYDVLSAVGAEQGRVLGASLAASGVVPGSVLHGAMRRQTDTATAMAEGAGWASVTEVDEGWNEFDHLGVVARGPQPPVGADDRRAFQQVFAEATGRWSGGAYDVEYDEPWPAFVSRIDAALERACAREGVTVVVTSGGPIAVACARLVDPGAAPAELAPLWAAFNTVVVNAAVSRVLVGSTGRRLLTFNEHSHLSAALVTYR
jgi:broad specificity phosphatase PhoE